MALTVKKNGFSLVEAIVGISLVFIFFLGIYSAFVFGLKVVGQSKAKATALALANQKIEEIENLPYKDIGTIGGIPQGTIKEEEEVDMNAVIFKVKTTVLYYDDPADGVAPDDSLPTDYKKIKVNVSWQGYFSGEVEAATYISPKGIETEKGGGTIKIHVMDANGEAVPYADIEVKNNNVSPTISASYQTDSYGDLIITGAPTSTEGYFIKATKNGYNEDRTYSREKVANPVKPYLSVFEGKVSEVSFSIDKESSFSIESRGIMIFNDDFENADKLSDYSDVSVYQGEVSLSKDNDSNYKLTGYLVSKTISPKNLVNWKALKWEDDGTDLTEVRYYLLYATSSEFKLVPDSDLPGNSAGFTDAPVDLSSLDVNKYYKLRIKGVLSSQSSSQTPILYSWEIDYNTPLLKNTDFHLQGSKIIGTNADGDNVYEYSKDLKTGENGYLNLYSLKWDSYTFSSNASTGVELVETEPSPQPINLLPAESKKTSLYFKADNSLVVSVNNTEGKPVFGANVDLNKEGFDQSKPTDENGKTMFIPLDEGLYNINVRQDGYKQFSGTVNVSGDSSKNIVLKKND